RDLRAISSHRIPDQLARQWSCSSGPWPIAASQDRFMRISLVAARVCASLLLTTSSAIAATIDVAAGGNLQTAINNAQSGDTITLHAGGTYTGNFKLPNKNGSALITIRTAGDAGLP